MNFSDILSFSGQAEFSPNSEYLAVVKGIKLTIYESASLGAVHFWNIVDQVSKLEWSSDSNLILCAQQKRGILQIFNLKDLKWDCKIALGQSGLSGAWFFRQNVLTICQFNIRLTIWSLSQKSVFSVLFPKFGHKGVVFSKCRNFVGILRRENQKDSILILDSELNNVSQFTLKGRDTENIIWTNDNFYLIAYENTEFYVYSPEGQLIHEYSNNRIILSTINSVNGCYFAISTSDNTIFMIHSITWTVLCQFSHSLEITDKNLLVYNEIESSNNEGFSYAMVETPLKLKGLENQRKPGIVKWSFNEKFLACKFGKKYLECTPHAVFIYDCMNFQLKSVLIHKNSVKNIEWCPTHTVCAICTGNNRVYLWTEEGASLCDLPFGIFYVERELCVNKFLWSRSGMYLIIREKGNIVIAYPQLDEIAN